MSVIIKCMEMPKNCYSCPLCHRNFDGNETRLACYALEDWLACYALEDLAQDDGDGRLPDCPLVEVPPHGRLIDADGIVNDCEKYIKTLNPDVDGKEISKVRWLLGVLNEQPTIVPEERNEDGK